MLILKSPRNLQTPSQFLHIQRCSDSLCLDLENFRCSFGSSLGSSLWSSFWLRSGLRLALVGAVRSIWAVRGWWRRGRWVVGVFAVGAVVCLGQICIWDEGSMKNLLGYLP